MCPPTYLICSVDRDLSKRSNTSKSKVQLPLTILSSASRSVQIGYQSICTGDAAIVVCGGQESMTRAPHTTMLREPVKMGNGTLTDSMLHDGLTDAFHHIHMGVTAENLAEKYQITRAEQDQFAVASQNKVEAAQKAGLYDKEIVPVPIKSRSGVNYISKDEFPRAAATLADVEKLRPCFVAADKGTVTPGNASGINDSAAAVLLMSEAEVAKRKLEPLARIVGFAQAGCDPQIMGIGVVPAVNKLLAKVGWTLDSVDVLELNEAFAAQALAVCKELGANVDRVNVNGGSISLGHPIGASGCRILVTLVHIMEQRNLKRGVASLCIGGGMGIAIAVERDHF